MEKYLKYLWIGQLLNLYGMALVKLSICTYILMLNFSKSFRILIWISIVVHISLNFVFPSIILFGECTPYNKHWKVTQPGSCWSTKPKVISGMKEFTSSKDKHTYNISSRVYGRCNQYCDGSDLHHLTIGLHRTSATKQAHHLGSSHCLPVRSHVSLSPLLLSFNQF
jgi:hypothetical protein